jgi:hypothetical protein
VNGPTPQAYDLARVFLGCLCIDILPAPRRAAAVQAMPALGCALVVGYQAARVKTVYDESSLQRNLLVCCALCLLTSCKSQHTVTGVDFTETMLTDIKESYFRVRDVVPRSLACGFTWNRLSVSSYLPILLLCTPSGRIHMRVSHAERGSSCSNHGFVRDPRTHLKNKIRVQRKARKDEKAEHTR